MRAAIEVADVFRAAGPAYRAAQAGHLSLRQLKVMAAIEQGGTIALANKEALVSAGEVMTAAVARHGATLLPVDSEHNAIFQCLQGGKIADVRSITLTASGGPLRMVEDLSAVTPSRPSRIPIGIWAPRSASTVRPCSTRVLS